MEPPGQTTAKPVIVPGNAPPVIEAPTAQPVDNVYVSVVVPAAMPVANPEVLPMVTTPVFMLAHVPPDGDAVSEAVSVAQMNDGAETMVGTVLTTCVLVT